MKQESIRTAGFISRKSAWSVAFASTLVLVTTLLTSCGKPTALPPVQSPTPESITTPEPSGASPLKTTTPEPSGTPQPSGTSSPDYTDGEEERGVEEREAVPKFPWPPPKWSASDMIPRELLVGNATHPTLGTVAQAIESAFEQAGYGQKSYYFVPGGFAMASQIEQINQDGSPKESFDRWSVKIAPIRHPSLGVYLNALFTAQAGYYRVIVFVVTPNAFTQNDKAEVTSETSRRWVSGGLNKLPEEIGSQEYSSAYSCTALIYEFKQTGKLPGLVEPSQITGKTHLDKAGLMAAFTKRR